MKAIRKFSTKWYVLLPVTVLFIVVSCHQEDAIAVKDYSGEEMFRGIFFMKGEVAESIESWIQRINAT